MKSNRMNQTWEVVKNDTQKIVLLNDQPYLTGQLHESDAYLIDYAVENYNLQPLTKSEKEQFKVTQ